MVSWVSWAFILFIGAASLVVWTCMFLTVPQKILVVLLERGPLKNSDIAERVGVTEQWCSRMLRVLEAKGLFESLLKPA